MRLQFVDIDPQERTAVFVDLAATGAERYVRMSCDAVTEKLEEMHGHAYHPSSNERKTYDALSEAREVFDASLFAMESSRKSYLPNIQGETLRFLDVELDPRTREFVAVFRQMPEQPKGIPAFLKLVANAASLKPTEIKMTIDKMHRLQRTHEKAGRNPRDVIVLLGARYWAQQKSGMVPAERPPARQRPSPAADTLPPTTR